MRTRLAAVATGIVILFAGCANCASGAEIAAYSITKSVPLGSPERWDFLSFDSTSHRVYVAHNSEITVVDGRTGKITGRVGGLGGVNGVAIVPELGKGYTASRGKKAGIIFDLATLQVIKEVPADSDTDAVIYDGASQRVFIMNGDPHSMTVIDTATDSVVATVSLDGAPEYAVVDGAGHLYVNVTDRREISRVDTRAAKVSASWPIRDCKDPHGLSMNTKTHRLFSSCLNSKLMVVDSDTGRVIATLPIGKESDGTAFDPKRRLILSSNGEGTLSVIREEGPRSFGLVGHVPTQPNARTMAIDPDSGRVYLVAGDKSVPGSVHLLFLDPR
jgi:YVTN family beta-propeller protein